MATFFVGQRVRINYLASPRHGCEARVIGPLELMSFPQLGIQKLAHDVELLNGIRTGDSGRQLAYAPHELEPIQPSGHRAGDYSLSELLDRCRAGEGVPA